MHSVNNLSQSVTIFSVLPFYKLQRIETLEMPYMDITKSHKSYMIEFYRCTLINDYSNFLQRANITIKSFKIQPSGM